MQNKSFLESPKIQIKQKQKQKKQHKKLLKLFIHHNDPV